MGDTLENLARGVDCETMLQPLQSRARRIVRIAEGRYALDLPLEVAPERLLSEMAAAGATLVSLNPIRDTLEDFFVQKVTAPSAQSASRQVDDRGRRAAS